MRKWDSRTCDLAIYFKNLEKDFCSRPQICSRPHLVCICGCPRSIRFCGRPHSSSMGATAIWCMWKCWGQRSFPGLSLGLLCPIGCVPSWPVFASLHPQVKPTQIVVGQDAHTEQVDSLLQRVCLEQHPCAVHGSSGLVVKFGQGLAPHRTWDEGRPVLEPTL